MRNLYLCVLFLFTISFVPCEEVFYRVIENAPAWKKSIGLNIRNNNNIALEIKKDTMVKGTFVFMGKIDTQWFYLCDIEYNENNYEMRADMLVPVNTVDLFADSWITKASAPDSLWLLDYYLSVLLSENRNTFYEYEYKIMNYWEESNELGIAEWYQAVDIDVCLIINQIGISAGGFIQKDFFITNIVKISNGYKITVIDLNYVKNIGNDKNNIAFPTNRHFFDLLLIKDNDFIDMYLDTTENHLATFVRVNKDIVDELTSLIKNNTCDLSKIKSWPKRADGSMDYSLSVSATDTNTTNTEDSVIEESAKEKSANKGSGFKIIMIAGIALLLGGGTAIFLIKRKK